MVQFCLVLLFCLVAPPTIHFFVSAAKRNFTNRFSMAPKSSKSAIGKNAAANRASAATAAAAAAASTAATAAGQQPSVGGSRAGTRSTPAPDAPGSAAGTIGALVSAATQPNGAAAAATAPSLASAIASPNTAAAVPPGDISQLFRDFERVQQELADTRHRLQQMQVLDTGASSRTHRPDGPAPRQPAETQFQPFVREPAPEVVFRDGHFYLTQGTIELLLAIGIGFMGLRMPSVLAQREHTFNFHSSHGLVTQSQMTAPVHHQIKNYLSSRQKPFPANWADLSGALASIARSHQDSFGTSAACQIADMLRLFDDDIEELRRLAAGAQHPVAIDQRVTDVCISAFRDGNPMIVPRVITNEIGSIRQEINRQLLRAPGQQRGGRGRAGGEYSGDPQAPAPAGKAGGRGKGGKPRSALLAATKMGHSKAHGVYIRTFNRDANGQYPSEHRCYKCGSLQHQMDGCIATQEVCDKWVQDAEPAP